MTDQPIALDALPPPAISSPDAGTAPGTADGIAGGGGKASPSRPPPRAPLERSLYRFIIRHSLRDQLTILAWTAVSLPFYYYSLDLPKTIINRAIQGKQFPVVLFGYSLGQMPYLMVLCAIFLALVFINGGFKYYTNVLRGRLGERMLRRLRFSLYNHILRFPVPHFRRTSPGEIIPMVTSEVEPLGGFIGDAVGLPAINLGLLATAVYFMFNQDVTLGLAAIALYPIQGFIIPKLQRRVNQLGKQRVRTIRSLADRIGESIGGIVEIRANDSARYQLADFAARLGRIYEIRYEIYQRKFFVKFLNNFLGQLTPFFFYSIGGYLVINGGLTAGALVAVLGAYKDLAGPWKELLDFYQLKEDSRIKYEQVVEQFEPAGLIDPQLQLDEPDEIPALTGTLAVTNISYVEEERRVVDGVSYTLPLDAHLAVVGRAGSGKNEFAMLLARLLVPSAGRILVGDTDLNLLPFAVTGRRIAYVGPSSGLFSASLRDNLLFGLRHKPTGDPQYDAAMQRRRDRALHEARRSGNIDFDLKADWTDYTRAGAASEAEMLARTVETLAIAKLDEDVYRVGLRGRLDPTRQPEAATRLLEARRALADRLDKNDMARLIERFDPERYNTSATLGDNLLFGTPVDATFEADKLAQNSYMRSVLDQVGLTGDLVAMGLEVAETMVELFDELPPDHEFWEQFSFIKAEDLSDFKVILERSRQVGIARLKPAERTRLLELPFKLIEPRHRLGLITDTIRDRVLQARKLFAEGLPEDLQSKIEFFDPGRYNAAASLQNNILFGSVAFGEAGAVHRVRELITEVLAELDLRQVVIEVGLDYQVGSGGARLSPLQRQKVAIARAVLKQPDILLLNEATASFDAPVEIEVMQRLRSEFAGRCVICVMSRASRARGFDRVIVFDQGRIVEQGNPDELDKPGTTLSTLVTAE